MTQSQDSSNEQVIWETYVATCKREGREPSIQDFRVWAQKLLKDL